MGYVFFLFILLSCGLGYRFLDLHRIGGALVYTDFLIVLLIGFLVLAKYKKNKLVRKTTVCAIFVLIYEIIFGLVSGAEMQFIIRDIKMWLYFFIPYWTTKYISLRKNDSTSRLIVHAVAVSIALTLFQCWIDFFINGLSNISRGSINRDFTIGLSFYCASFVILVIWANRNAILERIGIVPYVIIQIICFASVIVSYTRTNWILCITSFITLVIVMNVKNRNAKPSKKTIVAFLLFMGLVVISAFLIVGLYPDFVNTVLIRFISIGGQQVGNNINTFQHRVDYTMNTLVKFKSPKILFGWGLGDTQSGHANDLVWNCENSVLYYCWKYGLVASAILFISITHKTIRLIRSNNPTRIASGVFLIWFFIIGSWSGNMNYYYFLSFIAILLAFNKYEIIWNTNRRIIKERGYE